MQRLYIRAVGDFTLWKNGKAYKPRGGHMNNADAHNLIMAYCQDLMSFDLPFEVLLKEAIERDERAARNLLASIPLYYQPRLPNETKRYSC